MRLKIFPRQVNSLLIRLTGLLLGAYVLHCTMAWPQSAPLATEDRLQGPGWWPTKGSASRGQFTGPTVCAQCHSLKTASQQTTPMAHAATPASEAEILRQHEQLIFSSSPYTFDIRRAGGSMSYSVTSGGDSISEPLAWAFGAGQVGQTYVFQRGGSFYESRVSFYPALQGLDLTLGHRAPGSNNLAEAMGRRMAASETRLCFGCHTTASTTSGRFEASNPIPGITCEACHGPGARHVSAMKHKQIDLGLRTILNPAHLNPVDSVDFCGACHRTAWDVALTNTVGVANVRFQPYRLEKSRCWGQGDSRLTCVACHDPHVPLIRNPAAYDHQCLSCHPASTGTQNTTAPPAKACPVNTAKCVACHMPKYEIPGSHAQFTDHWIRIVKPDAAYPD